MFQTIMHNPWTNLVLLCCETDKIKGKYLKEGVRGR